MSDEDIVMTRPPRVPDWRLARALLLAETYKDNTLKFSAEDDDAVRELAKYSKDAIEKMPSKELFKKYRHTHEASVMRYTKGDTSPKWSIEALALAGLTAKEVSKRLWLDPKVVAAYLEYYYDMSDPIDREAEKASLHLYFKAYDHALLARVGYKFIAVNGGVDRYKRIVLNRTLMTAEDRKWLDDDSCNMRSIYTWSRTWEALGDGPVDPNRTPLTGLMMSAMRQNVEVPGAVEGKEELEGMGTVARALFDIQVKMADAMSDTKPPAVEPRTECLTHIFK